MIAILEKTEHNIDFHQIVDFLEASHIRKYSRRATRIAQSKALSPAADEPASLLGDARHEEAFPTELMKLCTSLQRQQTQMAAKIKDQDLEISGLKAKVKDVNVLGSMEADNILTSGVAAVSVSPVAGVSTDGVPTVSGSFPTVSAIFTTAGVVTPYTRRPRGITIGGAQQMRSLIIGAKDKGKKKVVESTVPKKRKFQEQIDAQVAKEMDEEFAREN
nr:hypothetical protein [Tanacetum cinerariifolium]